MSSPTSPPTSEEFSRSILYFPEFEALSFLNLTSQLAALTSEISQYPSEVLSSGTNKKANRILETVSSLHNELFRILIDARDLSSVYHPKIPLLEAYVQNSSYASFCKD